MNWEITGNSGTDPDVNFLGTSDEQPLVVKTNAQEVLRVDTEGNIGVGTSNPQNQLHVGSGSSSIIPSRVNAVFASINPDAGIAIAQNSGVNVLLQASGTGGYIGTTSNHPLVFRANDLDRIVVDTNGDVRITGDGTGVKGEGTGTGVSGHGKTWMGVYGFSESTTGGAGVMGEAVGPGVIGKSQTWMGVYGETTSTTGGAGVWGEHKANGIGTVGKSEDGVGISGFSSAGVGVRGVSSNLKGGIGDSGVGVLGEGAVNGVVGRSNGVGVVAESGKSSAIVATTRGTNTTALVINHWGSGNIIIGRDARNAEVFRVLNNGDVQVRGVTLNSDKNAKDNFSTVNTLQVLEKLSQVPIQTWKYKTDPINLSHIGPTAQDFHVAFGLNGDDNTHLSSIDVQGIALAAIQGLYEKVKAENNQLRTALADVERRLAEIESTR